MGEDYYKLLNIMHETVNQEQKLEEFLGNEELEEEQDFVYAINQDKVMRIPKVNSHMTRCFVDMYRFRPNATVNNYVVQRQDVKHSVLNPLLPSEEFLFSFL